ncbi:MAG: hypothetical protein V4638_03160 [Bacteroidota bacterium]
MYKELTTTQVIGITIFITGLVINNGFFIYSYYRISNRLKKSDYRISKSPFMPLSFYFQFRRLIQYTNDIEEKESHQKVLLLLNWSMIISIALMIIGFQIALLDWF